MCSPAPVVNQFGRDVAERFGIPTTYGQPGPGGVFLGSVGDQAHATRTSSHNCAPMQESPVNGVAYHPDYAHAWDARPATVAIGDEMVRETLPDGRVRYINFNDVRYFPDGRTESTDHPTFHVSFLPGTHNDTRPFFEGDDDVKPEDIREINRGTALIVGAAANQLLTAIRSSTRILRRAIWKAYGKTKAEIAKLEAEDPIEDTPLELDEG